MVPKFSKSSHGNKRDDIVGQTIWNQPKTGLPRELPMYISIPVRCKITEEERDSNYISRHCKYEKVIRSKRKHLNKSYIISGRRRKLPYGYTESCYKPT